MDEIELKCACSSRHCDHILESYDVSESLLGLFIRSQDGIGKSIIIDAEKARNLFWRLSKFIGEESDDGSDTL